MSSYLMPIKSIIEDNALKDMVEIDDHAFLTHCSMGCKVPATECSLCGWAPTDGAPWECEHVRPPTDPARAKSMHRIPTGPYTTVAADYFVDKEVYVIEHSAPPIVEFFMMRPFPEELKLEPYSDEDKERLYAGLGVPKEFLFPPGGVLAPFRDRLDFNTQFQQQPAPAEPACVYGHYMGEHVRENDLNKRAERCYSKEGCDCSQFKERE